jgi:V/A-type H+-transporting ATPase subunit E
MAVEDILNRITADAEEAVRRIVAEGKAKADEVTAEARGQIDAQAERMRAKARQRADEEKNRIVTLARLSGRRELLSEKQRLIDRVFAETRESILGMGRDEYRRLIRAFLLDARDDEDAEVIIDAGEKRIDQDFLDKVAREVAGGRLRLSGERRGIGGGFILRSGRTETNCTLETILRDARERLETEVASILFGADAGT